MILLGMRPRHQQHLACGVLPRSSGVAHGASPGSFVLRLGRRRRLARGALLRLCRLALGALLVLLGLRPRQQQRLAFDASLLSSGLALGASPGPLELCSGRQQRLARGALLWSLGLAPGASPGLFDARLWRRRRLARGFSLGLCCSGRSALLGSLGPRLRRLQRSTLGAWLGLCCLTHSALLCLLALRRQWRLRGASLRSSGFARDASPGLFVAASLAAAIRGTWCLVEFVLFWAQCLAWFAWAAPSASAMCGACGLAVVVGLGVRCLVWAICTASLGGDCGRWAWNAAPRLGRSSRTLDGCLSSLWLSLWDGGRPAAAARCFVIGIRLPWCPCQGLAEGPAAQAVGYGRRRVGGPGSSESDPGSLRAVCARSPASLEDVRTPPPRHTPSTVSLLVSIRLLWCPCLKG